MTVETITARVFLASLFVWGGAANALANDSFAGIGAGGLVFKDTYDVVMASEDLRIGRDEIRVTYVFRNESEEDVAGAVAFPLPPLDLFTEMYGDFPFSPEELTTTNFTKFSVRVNGQTIAPETAIRAVMPPEGGDLSPYGEGADVSETLRENGIPLGFDTEAIDAAFRALPAGKRQELVEAGLFGHPGGEMYEPRWRIAITHYWDQTFKAGAETRIEHRYEPVNAAWFFELNDDQRRKFCIDAGTEKAIAALSAAQRKEHPDMGELLVATGVRYILTTAESWKGPIGHFRLTIDKGSPKSVVSLCIGEIAKTGPTTFVFEKDGYVPERDLAILLVDRPDMAQ